MSITTPQIIAAAQRIPWLMEIAADEEIEDEARNLADEELGILLEALADGSEDKLDALRAVSVRMATEAAMLAAESKRLTRKARAAKSGVERCKALAASLLQTRRAAGMGAKVKTPSASYWLKESVSVDVAAACDVGSLPDGCFRLGEPKADKTAIKKRLQAGDTIEGCALIEKESISWR
jgi:hypothetical protein